jgi:hypothetical protein
MINQQEHAYPGYQMERAFLERAVREHKGVIPELALGLLETTEILARQAQDLRELARGYQELASAVTSNSGPFGGYPHEWTERRTALACEAARLGVE